MTTMVARRTFAPIKLEWIPWSVARLSFITRALHRQGPGYLEAREV